MSEEEPVDDLVQGLSVLPPKFALAFCARCALRILPVFYPGVPGGGTEAIKRIAAAEMSCVIALHTSIDAEAAYGHLGVYAAEMLEGPVVPEMDNVKKCIQYTALAASSADPRRLPQTTEIYELCRITARRLEVFDSFEAAASSDFAELRRLNTRNPDRATVPGEFFSRPLFDPPAASWESMITRWTGVLDNVQLVEARDRYLKLYRGGSMPDAKELSRAIDKWATGSRISQETTNKGDSPRQSRSTDTSSASSQRPSDATTSSVPAASASDTRTDVWMWPDRPMEPPFKGRDPLGFRDYADAIATLLNHDDTGTPFTMAINAPWGAGKTSLANMVIAELDQRRKDQGQPLHIICRFNAWMHDDAPNVATAFVSEVSRTANRHRSWLQGITSPLPIALLEPGMRKVRRVLIGMLIVAPTLLFSGWIADHLHHVEEQHKRDAVMTSPAQQTVTIVKDASGKESHTESTSYATSRPTPPPAKDTRDRFDPFFEWLEHRLVLLGAFFTALAGLLGVLVRVWATATPLAGFVQAHDKAAESGAIPSAGKQLKKLIEQATRRGNRFIVFIDDIERCKPPRAVDVLDAINQLMDHQGVMIVLLGDMAAVAAAAQMKYRKLAKIYVPNAGIAIAGPDSGKEAFGRLYLQKIIQFQFDLPIPPPATMKMYVEELAVSRPPQGGERVARAI